MLIKLIIYNRRALTFRMNLFESSFPLNLLFVCSFALLIEIVIFPTPS